MFKTLALKWLESRFLKGKITYAGIGVAVLPLIAKALGIDVTGPEVDQLVQAIGLAVALAGRVRAAHQA
jgi:hypothetical protein